MQFTCYDIRIISLQMLRWQLLVEILRIVLYPAMQLYGALRKLCFLLSFTESSFNWF